MATVTVDVKKAVRVLKEAGQRIRKSNLRSVARAAAGIARDDLRSASGPVPKYQKAKYHLFSRPGYKVKIRAGNLRKSMVIHTFRRSKLLWVGPKYRKSLNGQTIGESLSTADGFYASMVIAKTNNDFIAATATRKGSQITAQLQKDGDAFIARIAQKANATP